ncbi:hypothetical protein [Candidatus Endolissoclinum faulkneri]|nr:hypothetical protein [Candidatus Endolissoclinum faulkneri]
MSFSVSLNWIISSAVTKRWSLFANDLSVKDEYASYQSSWA